MSKKPSLVVFLHDHHYDRVYQAASLLLTAASMGWSCHLFLFYGALASFMNGTWDDVSTAPGDASRDGVSWDAALARGFESDNRPSIYDMIRKAREEPGGLKVLACSHSCRLLDLDTSAVGKRADGVVGLHTMLQLTEHASHALYI